MEKEVRETLEKELRARLKEEAEQKEKEDARGAELSGSLAGIRQEPCRHGYHCRHGHHGHPCGVSLLPLSTALSPVPVPNSFFFNFVNIVSILIFVVWFFITVLVVI